MLATAERGSHLQMAIGWMTLHDPFAVWRWLQISNILTGFYKVETKCVSPVQTHACHSNRIVLQTLRQISLNNTRRLEKKFMGNINVGDVRIDMVLAKDVKNINGQLLMPKGMKITEKHLAVLQAWGITEVEIEGVSQEEIANKAAAEIDPKILAQAEAHIADLFQHTDRNHPAIKELASQCTLRRARLQAMGGLA